MKRISFFHEDKLFLVVLSYLLGEILSYSRS